MLGTCTTATTTSRAHTSLQYFDELYAVKKEKPPYSVAHNFEFYIYHFNLHNNYDETFYLNSLTKVCAVRGVEKAMW